MRSAYRAAVLLLIVFGLSAGLMLRSQQPRSEQTQIARGKYLVEEVAKCTECHTPRDDKNQLERDRWLEGATIWIEPVMPTSNWAEFAPALAGLPNFTDEQVERVLEMGEGAGETPLQPPMHIYHLNHQDAQDIIAYLRSLRPAKTER